MDPMTIALIGGLLSGLSTWKGTHDASKQNRKTQKMIDQDLKQAEADRMKAGNNFLDTEEGKAIANQASEALAENNRAVNNNAIKSGATTEQRLAAQAAGQKAYNQTLQNLAARSTQWKQYQDALLNQARRQHTQSQTAINNAAAQSDVNSGVGVANAIGNITSAAISTKKSTNANAGGNANDENAAGVTAPAASPAPVARVSAPGVNNPGMNGGKVVSPFTEGVESNEDYINKYGNLKNRRL